ncbi:interleukin-1 receptor type 1 [Megalobrama amblycephala]|uniref:interleukin-1 receptor type 1 n=1 Tax=Megalobrama amblycephala TaxID=75352 RepID=UPI002013D5ED|nr:interleukin-1 receptor type 1 [Megalobrama amblycephala]XP_048050871.1 interleukin-1 receptor type 1 [Megalobrama amblycephala]
MPRTPEMSFSTFYLRWIFLPVLWVAGFPLEEIKTESKSFAFTAGLASRLECITDSPNVSWSRVPSQSLENISGITIKDHVLWFLPARPVHSGQYSCLRREGNDTWETIYTVSVRNETCPPMNRQQEVMSTKELECFLPHIFELDPGAQVTWRNHCHPLNVTYSKFFPVNRSPESAGEYTCFVNFTFEGQNYFAAQTTEINFRSRDFVVTKPEILLPKEETFTVTLGKSFNLSCQALAGKNDMGETSIYWYSDSDSLDVNYSQSITFKDGRKYMQAVLSISEVTAEYLYTDLTCMVQHSAGSDSVTVILIPASQKERNFWICFGLVALVFLLGAVAFLGRVDLVLAYRRVCPSAAGRSDGKSYDAYVSYLHGDQLSSSSAMTFALRFLPAVLEDLYGYKLFISGRDELPGEAVHEVVADRMSRSRRLIIVLTSQSCAASQTDPTKRPLVSEYGVRLEESSSVYEQRVGLYDALVKQGLKVILVQVEDGVEEALLPESLRYICRTRGILRWRQNGGDHANRRFWKYVRYHMPPAQKR